MRPQIFINLPVFDLQKSITFYEALGFSINPSFSDDSSKCMFFSEEIFVMLMTYEKFSTFNQKTISNPKETINGIYALSVENLEILNQLIENGKQAGGHEFAEMKDYGFMQLRTLEDPDGYVWELFYMDMSKFPNQ